MNNDKNIDNLGSDARSLYLERSWLELWVAPFFFAAIALLTSFDIASDLGEVPDYGHLMLELLVTFISIGGVWFFLRKNKALTQALAKEALSSESLKKEALEWKLKHESSLKGFSAAIEEQLLKWKLSPAEKEVAFYLLKGFSTFEIATFRKVSEKTIKLQCSSVYSKSGLSGRAELSAFFLEDLL